MTLPTGKIKADSATTLVEMIMVASILGFIFFLVIPSLNPIYARLQLKGVSDYLVSTMQHARLQAIYDNREYRIVLDPVAGKYWLEKEESRKSFSSDEAKNFTKIEGRHGKKYSLPKDVVVSISQNPVIFYANGLIDHARISLCCRNRCMDISTAKRNGYIEVGEYSEK